MHTHRFVVFQVKHEWFVVYEGCRRLGFTTHEEVEASAFNTVDEAIPQGYTVSVLV